MTARAVAPIRRRTPNRGPTESQIGRAVAAFLDLVLPPNVRWTHIASGGHRSKATAGKLRAEGVRKGAPDYVIVAPGVIILWIELKRPQGGRLSEAQEGWRDALRAVPGAVAWAECRSVEDVAAALRSVGIPMRCHAFADLREGP